MFLSQCSSFRVVPISKRRESLLGANSSIGVDTMNGVGSSICAGTSACADSIVELALYWLFLSVAPAQEPAPEKVEP